jgi:hypothetical protein
MHQHHHHLHQDASFFSHFKFIPAKMFKRAFRSQDQPQNRVDKAARLKKSGGSAKEHVKAKVSKLQISHIEHEAAHAQPINITPSPIVTLTIGREGRLFAAHEDVLSQSPFFEEACKKESSDVMNKRISLPDEEPEIFSAVLEYLYKGDYYPRPSPPADLMSRTLNLLSITTFLVVSRTMCIELEELEELILMVPPFPTLLLPLLALPDLSCPS